MSKKPQYLVQEFYQGKWHTEAAFDSATEAFNLIAGMQHGRVRFKGKDVRRPPGVAGNDNGPNKPGPTLGEMSADA